MIDVGVGLPSTVPGGSRKLVRQWIQQAEEGPFSSLGMVDKPCYAGHDTMVSMAFAAAATERMRLMVTVMVAVLREPVLLAKQAATLDVLTEGRFVLGVGAGELFTAADFALMWPDRDYAARGRQLDEHLTTLRRVWAGDVTSPEGSAVGPPPFTPGGPPILIGASTPVGIKRVGTYGDGYMGSGQDPALERAKPMADIALRYWEQAGRPGRPMLKKAVYYALGGPEAVEGAVRYFNDISKAYIDPRADATYTTERWVNGLVHSPEMVRTVLSVYEDAGYDEVVFWPTVGALDQLDRLGDAVG